MKKYQLLPGLKFRVEGVHVVCDDATTEALAKAYVEETRRWQDAEAEAY